MPDERERQGQEGSSGLLASLWEDGSVDLRSERPRKRLWPVHPGRRGMSLFTPELLLA